MTTEAPRRARRAQSSAAADRAIVEGLVAQARFSSLPTPEDLARMAGITLYRAVRAIQAAQHEVEAALAAPTASPATRRQRSSARRSAAAAAAAASEEAPASEAEDAAPAATPAEAPASGRAFRTLPEALSPLPRRRAPGADGRDRCRAAGPPQPSLKPFASVPADRLSEVPGEARWRLVRARFDREVGKIRYNSHLLDAYEGEGWAGLNTEKLVPRAELASAREKIQRSKSVVRAHLRSLAALQADLPKQHYDEDGIDASHIFCSACGEDGDEDQKGDIVLCDAQGCDRAFHLQCLDPPIAAEDVPEGDADWMCHRCACEGYCFQRLNEEFGFGAESWEQVFPEAAEGVRGSDAVVSPHTNASRGREDGSDTGSQRTRAHRFAAPLDDGDSNSSAFEVDDDEVDDDEDAGAHAAGPVDEGDRAVVHAGGDMHTPTPRRRKRARVAEAVSAARDAEDAASTSGAALVTLPEGDRVSLEVALEQEAQESAADASGSPVPRKRRRKPVDYIQLAHQLFGGVEEEVDPEDGAWTPSAHPDASP